MSLCDHLWYFESWWVMEEDLNRNTHTKSQTVPQNACRQAPKFLGDVSRTDDTKLLLLLWKGTNYRSSSVPAWPEETRLIRLVFMTCLRLMVESVSLALYWGEGFERAKLGKSIWLPRGELLWEPSPPVVWTWQQVTHGLTSLKLY